MLVSYDGAVKLIDFGIAKWSKRQTETRYGGIKGKIAYMSPEQCRAGSLDRRSDVFGLGILLYELTTGTRLFQGISDFAVLEQIVHDDVPLPSTRRAGYPAEVEQIVMKALARDPARRYESGRALQLELEEYALENKLMISAMARAAEMESLFGHKVGAWREAAHAGRSLGEHLAAERTRTRPEVPETYLLASHPSPSRTRRRVLVGAGAALAAGAASWMLVRKLAAPPLAVPPPVFAPVAGPTAPTGDIALDSGVERPAAVNAERPPPPRRVRRRTSARTQAPRADAPPATANKDWDPDSIYLP